METSRDDFAIAFRYAFLKKGAQQKFSLFALILTSIVVLIIDSTEIKFFEKFRQIIKDGVYRASVVVSIPNKTFSFFQNKIDRHFLIYTENKKLLEENQKLKELKFELDFTKAHNKRLSELLDTNTSNKFRKINAKVMIDRQSPFLKSIIINKGVNSEIQKGMPVLSNANLIGRVVEANYFSSRVLLLSDLNSKTPVLIAPDGEQAILSGKGEKNPILEFLPEQHNLKDGDKIFTSGMDGVFYEGIPVGEIKKTKSNFEVLLNENPNQIYYVTVVLNNMKNQ
jgi:rod shape-determining protein MreC